MPARTPFDMFTGLPLPDPLLARRALGGVRTVMRSGYGVARDMIDRAPLPAPAMAIAGTVLNRVDDLTQLADAAASTVARGVLAAAGVPLDGNDDGRALCAALRATLVEMRATELRVSEAAVREAKQRDRPGPAGDVRAAALMQLLLAARAVRSSDPGAEVSTVIPVAVFAALLAEMQEVAGDPAGIAASAAISDAIAEEIRGAGSDRAALARLFAEFADHV